MPYCSAAVNNCRIYLRLVSELQLVDSRSLESQLRLSLTPLTERLTRGISVCTECITESEVDR
jgi:hypothetical protein